jgi:hypothetical protein
MMPGRNFLAWHRQFILQLERRLQVVHPKWRASLRLQRWVTSTNEIASHVVPTNIRPHNCAQKLDHNAVDDYSCGVVGGLVSHKS